MSYARRGITAYERRCNSFSMAVSAGGTPRAMKITPLMTVEEAVEAVKKAGKTGYRPPIK